MSLTIQELRRAAEVAETWPKRHAGFWGCTAKGDYTSRIEQVAPGKERRRHANRQVSTLNPLTSSVAGWTVKDEEAST